MPNPALMTKAAQKCCLFECQCAFASSDHRRKLCLDLLLQANAGGEERSEWELCFACPSQTASAFLEALSATAEHLMPLTMPAQTALDQIVELVEALKVAHPDYESSWHAVTFRCARL